MLSSTVVTVLAPQWNGRPRRTKRPEVTGNWEAQGGLHDVTNTATNRSQGRFQSLDRLLTDGSQAQSRVPFLGTRRNTVGWSTKSGPESLDYESKRKMIHTVSLDVNSGRMNGGKIYASPVHTAASPVSPLSFETYEQRTNPHPGHQGGLPSLSSKPTTSRMLLSLRRCNSNSRINTIASPTHEMNPLSPSSSPRHQDGKLFTTHLSQTFPNNNGQVRSKPFLSPSGNSYRTTETGPIISTPSSNQRERNTFETRFFSNSPTSKGTEDTPFSQQAETMTSRTRSSLSCFQHPISNREPTENCRGSHKSTNVFSESSTYSPKHSPFDRSSHLNTHSLPRRTNLTSTSWWKQVTQDCSSNQTINDTTNIKEKINTPSVPPYNHNRDLASACPTEEKRCVSQTPNNRDHNNTIESVGRSNINLIMTKQGGTDDIKLRIAGDSPGHRSDKLVKQQYSSNLNNRDPQKPHSLPDVFPTSKISRATKQTMLNHPPKDLSRHDLNTDPFTANKTELPLALLNPKSSNTPTESSSNYSQCASKTPASSHNPDSEKFGKPPLSLATTNSFCIQSPTSTTISGLSQCPYTKPTSYIHSHPVASQTPIGDSPYTSSSSQIPLLSKVTYTTPLRYERSIASAPKPFHPKTVSSPTDGAFSKTNYTTATTASPSCTFSSGSQHVAITAHRTSVLTSSLTPGITSCQSSLLTPPATPNIMTSSKSIPSSLKEARTFSNSPENDPKKKCCVGGKRVRRVTWEDSVDLKHSEPVAVDKAEAFPVPTSSSSLESGKVTAIASFMRSRRSTTNSPSPKTSIIHGLKGERYRSLSSDCADLVSRDHERCKQRLQDTIISEQGMRDVTPPRQERTLSVDSDTLQCRSSAPLSLPPDFSSCYKLRYSSPPYSTLIATRPTQGETKTILSRSPLFQRSQSNYTPHLSRCTDSEAPMTTSKPPLSPTNRGSAKGGVSETDIVNNNHSKSNRQDFQNGQIVLVHNRLHEAHSPSSKCVTETLVYSVKSKEETATAAPRKTTPKPLQPDANPKASVETELSQQSHRIQSKEAAREPNGNSELSSGVSRSNANGKVKENMLDKSRFFSLESNNEHSTKRSRFALKKSDSTPSSSLSRSQSETASKPSNKMDQVFSRLKQKFSTRLSDEDVFPWKWKRASQTSSVSGSGDVSDNTVESAQKLEDQEQEKGILLKDNEKGTDCVDRWKTNRYSLILPSVPGEELYSWSDQTTPETDRDEQTAYPEYMESQSHPHFTITSPTTNQLDLYKDSLTDSKPSNLFLYGSNRSPGRSPKTSAESPTQLNKSTSGPRSPFSPFPSLSPVSQITSSDDNVFFSPKLQRHRASPSPCEPGEGLSLAASRRTRASTGPPSASPGLDNERLPSSYADLKYGIEPGKSFSVSSVLSSRPSGPGRISTGSRFMSVGDLSDFALTTGKPGKDLDQWSVNPDWTTDYDSPSSKDCRQACFPSDPGKMRSRSLPRSLTRRLANWSSEAFGSQPATGTTSKSARLWSPNVNHCHFAWDTEGPPTPPPTPPLSPPRRMSKPPRLPSPTFPTASGASQHVDNLSPRGTLPSRGYVSSLTTFDESSDSSSDTTTDDEYYLETGEEKETEL
ncbi:uncharacterized protein AB9W97_005528 isoform 1-T2 [Spinachia spinachia]